MISALRSADRPTSWLSVLSSVSFTSSSLSFARLHPSASLCVLQSADGVVPASPSASEPIR